MMVRTHGWQAIAALRVPPERLLADRGLTLPGRLIELAPVTLPLGLFGAVRAIRTALVDETNRASRWAARSGSSGWWSPPWPRRSGRSGPQSAFDLVLLVPLSLLAAQTIADLVNRRIPVREPDLAGAGDGDVGRVVGQRRPARRRRRRDPRPGRRRHRRWACTWRWTWWSSRLVLIRAVDAGRAVATTASARVIAAFLLAVLAVTAVDGLLEVVFRHGIDRDLLALRTMILRRNRDNPFQVVAVVSPPASVPAAARAGPEAATVQRGAVARRPAPLHPPHGAAAPAPADLTDIAELFDLPEGQRLVILAGTEQRLDRHRPVPLGLEAIHPGRSGILDAYATARVAQPAGGASTASERDRAMAASNPSA